MPNINQYSIIYNGEVVHPPKTKPMEIIDSIESQDEMMQRQSNVLDEALKQMTAIYVSKVDEIIEEGLKLKGFDFKNRFELTEFIKANCKLEHNLKTRKNIYYVNGIPFLSQHFPIDKVQMPEDTKRGILMCDVLGEFKYL